LEKIDSKVDEGIFLSYSSRRKAYQCYNKTLRKIVESVNVKVDEARHEKVKAHVQTEESSHKEEGEENEEEQIEHQNTKTPSRFSQKNHSKNQILGDKGMGV
jgi:predicted GNAT family acetyltransferase